MNTTLPLVYDIPLFVLLVIAVYTELAEKKIYNWVTVPAFCIGVILHGFLEGWQGVFFSLIGCAVGAGIFFVAYLLGGVGGGDVKLIGAIGALAGYLFVMRAIFYSALIGAVMAVVVMAKRGGLKAGLRRIAQLCAVFFNPSKRKAVLSAAQPKEIPYGVAIVMGTFLVLLKKYLFW
jgi:prepilin peptidase CpaA